jgi:4-hydroxy-2-oxoheptanedioate aldolase
MLGGAASAEVLAAASFDAAVVDLQHGAATLDRAGEIFAAIERRGATPFVRVMWNDPAELMRVLDLGARGVICPMVGSREEAEAFVAACRYPPVGVRSYGPVRGAFATGWEQAKHANETILTFAMIETREGLDHVEAIAATPGLSGLFVGPGDLSLALGLSSFADLGDSPMLDALNQVLGAAKRHGLVPGIYAPQADRALEMVSLGFRFVACAMDANLLGDAAADSLARIRKDQPGFQRAEP